MPLLDDRADTPATSYRRLPTPLTATVAACLAVLTVVAWIVTARKAESMSGMVMGIGHVGRAMRMDIAVSGFATICAVMMVAMMAPTVAPVALAHSFVRLRRGEGVGSTVALVGGYFTVWWLLGALYFLAFLWFFDLSPGLGDSQWLAMLGGGILLVAGAYQFTPWKAACLRACCTPLTLVADRSPGRGVSDGFRIGATRGLHCLGCCWAAMAVLSVVGLMNLVWMIGLSLLFLAEKHSSRALSLRRPAGAGLVALGVAVIVDPTLLHTISGVRANAPP